MDTKTLTPEERQAVTQLVKSPGWAVILHHLCIPSMHSAAAQLDSLATLPQSHRDIMRGVKHAYKQLLETVYHIAELPNPFEQHALALFAVLQQSIPPVPLQTPQENDTPLQERLKRVSYPV